MILFENTSIRIREQSGWLFIEDQSDDASVLLLNGDAEMIIKTLQAWLDKKALDNEED